MPKISPIMNRNTYRNQEIQKTTRTSSTAAAANKDTKTSAAGQMRFKGQSTQEKNPSKTLPNNVKSPLKASPEIRGTKRAITPPAPGREAKKAFIQTTSQELIIQAEAKYINALSNNQQLFKVIKANQLLLESNYIFSNTESCKLLFEKIDAASKTLTEITLTSEKSLQNFNSCEKQLIQQCETLSQLKNQTHLFKLSLRLFKLLDYLKCNSFVDLYETLILELNSLIETEEIVESLLVLTDIWEKTTTHQKKIVDFLDQQLNTILKNPTISEKELQEKFLKFSKEQKIKNLNIENLNVECQKILAAKLPQYPTEIFNI